MAIDKLYVKQFKEYFYFLKVWSWPLLKCGIFHTLFFYFSFFWRVPLFICISVTFHCAMCMEDSLVNRGNSSPGHGPAPACRVPRTADWLPAAGLEPPEPRPAAGRQHEAIKCGDCGTLFRISGCSHNHHIAVHQLALPPAWTSLPPPAILLLGKWCLLC